MGVLLWHKKTCLVLLCHKKTCLLVTQEDMSSCGTRKHVFLCHNKTPNSKKHNFYTISDRPFPELFGDPFKKKRTIFIPCVLGPTEFTFLPLWGLGAVEGHRDHNPRPGDGTARKKLFLELGSPVARRHNESNA